MGGLLDLSSGLQLVFHGSITVLAALLAGFLYGRAIALGDPAAERQRAWRLVHVAGALGGLSLFAVAGVEPLLGAGAVLRVALHAGLLVSNYAFLVAMTLAAATGVRGLHPGPGTANRVVFGLYTLAVTTLLGAVAALIYASCVALVRSS